MKVHKYELFKQEITILFCSALMASCSFPDVWGWIQTLPPITVWRTNSMSLYICSSQSTRSSLNLTVTKNVLNNQPSLFFSVIADFKIPISLWTSQSYKIKTQTAKLLDEETISSLLQGLISDVLHYSPNNGNSFFRIPPLDTIISNFRDIMNLSFLTLTLLVCIYEAPQDLRLECLNSLKNHLTSSNAREASKLLMRLLGSNIEEQWMRSVNLAITNWIVELKASDHNLRSPSSLFSYAISTVGLCKVQLYCPIIAMSIHSSSSSTPERLLFSLLYHQLEGVLQLEYKVVVRDKWVDVGISVDNIRCDVIRLVSETLMAERGMGKSEKHFPSRISLQLTPTLQTNVLSVSVSKSSENPAREIGLERGLEAGFDAPGTFLGLKVSAAETMTMSLKPWKFEQSVHGNSANLNWFLHDAVDGREVFTSKPSKLALLHPKAWFKNRYSSAYRPFTKQGGIIFAGDEYGKSTWWKVDRKATGTTMEWEIKGWIWLTYWPNKHTTLYTETRRLEFRETLHLAII